MNRLVPVGELNAQLRPFLLQLLAVDVDLQSAAALLSVSFIWNRCVASELSSDDRGLTGFILLGEHSWSVQLRSQVVLHEERVRVRDRLPDLDTLKADACRSERGQFSQLVKGEEAVGT